MDKLQSFYKRLCAITDCNNKLTIDSARKIVQQINDFLFTNYEDIGETQALGETFQYFSEFHKFWEANYKEILDIKIDEIQCEKIVDALLPIYRACEIISVNKPSAIFFYIKLTYFLYIIFNNKSSLSVILPINQVVFLRA